MSCSLNNCDNPVNSKGLCRRHYRQQWATGSPEIIRPNPRGTVEERFWRHVNKGGSDECWLWTGNVDNEGYGMMRGDRAAGNPMRRVTHISYELHIGPIPEGSLIRHFRCNNPPCVNPAHLLPGDHLANMQDRKAAGNYKTGERAAAAKFSDETVEAVRIATGTNRAISKRYGMSESQVGNIKRGVRCWRGNIKIKPAEQEKAMPSLFSVLESELEKDEIDLTELETSDL